MVEIYYSQMVLVISALWLLVRVLFWLKNKKIDWIREAQLLLVYICIIVVVRFTFCPFGKVDGKIQPLIFDAANAFPPRINWIPMVNLLDYEVFSEILLNLIGNTAMFIPLGIVWPVCFKRLNTRGKVIAAGFGFSLCIEILQLPFYDRVTDVDDLILNTAGYLIGYGIYLLVKRIASAVRNHK